MPQQGTRLAKQYTIVQDAKGERQRSMRLAGVASPSWVRWFYRITAPRHPRGWVEFRLLESGGLPLLRTDGLSRKGLPELEMLDPPADLLGPVHGIFMALMDGIARSARPAQSGETMGGKFVSQDQTYLETCRLRNVGAGSDPVTLRICDLDDDGNAAPIHLIATHLCSLAESAKSDEKLRLLTRATEIYPKVVASSEAPLDKWAVNPNNFAAWEGLGNEFAERGDAHKAIQCWRTAVALWPAGGLQLSKELCARLSDGRLRAEESVRQFWCELSPAKIREFCRELGMRAAALAAEEQ